MSSSCFCGSAWCCPNFTIFFSNEAVNVGDGISWRFMAANVEGSTTIGTQTLVRRLGCRDHPEKTPGGFVTFQPFFFLLCMEYNYILKTIVGASSLRGITGEKRLHAFTTPWKHGTGFPGLFLLFPGPRCLIHFLNSSSPLRKRAGWWDRISLLWIWLGEWKAREKVWITCFFRLLGAKRLVYSSCQFVNCEAQQKHLFFGLMTFGAKQS